MKTACIRYVTNLRKTNDGLLVTYSGCQAETITHNFQAALSMNRRQAAEETHMTVPEFEAKTGLKA